ncbi:MAG: hypothetical protein AAEJ46_01160 [Planctomycetota bacterium]
MNSGSSLCNLAPTLHLLLNCGFLLLPILSSQEMDLDRFIGYATPATERI